MNLFKVFTGNYSDSASASVESQGPEGTILTLCSRLKSSQLLADRRDAVRGLKALAKSYRKEVAYHCLEPLINCLCKDRSDHEVTSLCLDSLCSIFSEEDGSTNPRIDGSSEVLTEEMLTSYAEKLTTEEVFSTILACLEENDFVIRFPAIRLLISLLQLRNRDFQQLVLLNPTAVARFMDLLSDVREAVRNDVLVLLIHLTRGNSSIQKIVVFENVFEKLFSIMASEGYADGGVVTSDCLELTLSLLAGNAANQLLFREGSFIQHLVPFFDSLPSSQLSVQKTWTNEKTENFILLFQLIRHLVTPGSGQQQIAAVQRIAHQCGLLRKIAELLSEAGLPSPVLVEALGAVGELSRDLATAQDSVIQLNVASMRPPRPLVVVLLMSLINDRQPLNLRLSILYCVQCLLYRNKSAQMNIIRGMCPEAAEAMANSHQVDSQLAFSTSAGQLIVSGLMALDSPSTWLTAGVLIAALGSGQDNGDLRQSLLRAQLALSLGAQPVTLLQQTTTTLAMQKLRLSTRAGLLQLLCVWLAYCPQVVDTLLSDAPAVACLLSQVSQPPSDPDESVVRALSAFAIGLCILYNGQADTGKEYSRDKLVMIVRRRIGIETFGDALAAIATNDDYTRCLRSPRPTHMQLSSNSRSDDAADASFLRLPLFTHEFSVIYRQLEPDVLRSLSITHHQQTSTTIPSSNLADSQFSAQSKASVDGINTNGSAASDALRGRVASLEASLADRNAECEQLRREVASYKMAIADGANEYRSVLAEKDRAIGQLQAELMAARSFAQHRGLEKNSSECVVHFAEIEKLKADLSSLRQEQDDLLLLLSHQDSRIARLRDKLHQFGGVDSEEEEDDEEDGENADQRDAEGNAGASGAAAHARKIKIGLGESAFGIPAPPQPSTMQSQPAVADYGQGTFGGEYPTAVSSEYHNPAAAAAAPPGSYVASYGYPYPYHQQQYPYPQQQYQYAPNNNNNNNLPDGAAVINVNAQQAAGLSGVENYFSSVVISDIPQENGDRDGSESAATSDSQNSQIRIQ